MGFVNCFTDIESSESCEDKSLNSTGEKAQKHHRQGNNQWNQEGKHCNSKLISKESNKALKKKAVIQLPSAWNSLM